MRKTIRRFSDKSIDNRKVGAQVGQCLVNLLSERNDIEIVAYDCEQLDITSEQQVQITLTELKPNVVINAAAHTAVDKAETDTPGVYGQSKLAGEEALAEYCSRYATLRTACVFREHGNNFVKTMLHLGKSVQSLELLVTSLVGRPMLVMIMSQYSGKAQADVYHFSRQSYVSWYQFARAIFEANEQNGLLDKQPQLNGITADQYPLPALRPTNSRLD